MNYHTQALELYNRGSLKEAALLLQRGLQEREAEGPGDGPAHHLLGIIFYQQGRFKASLKHLYKACEKNPDTQSLLNLSIVLNDLGRYGEGGLVYARALKRRQQNTLQNFKEEVACQHRKTGDSYLRQGYLKEALKQYLSVLEFQPQDLKTHIQVARLLWELKQPQMALKHLRSVISLAPRLTEARLLLARWLFIQKQTPEAVKEWEIILKREPDNRQARAALMKAQEAVDFYHSPPPA